eukprot:c21235_g1_i1 orf=108-908(+)
MEPPLFSPAALFGLQEEETDEDLTRTSEPPLEFAERNHAFPGMVLSIREFAFHQVNANLLWPGTLSFAEWLVVHQHVLKGRLILELGSGTGALAIFLKKAFAADITTSDFDDEIIEENIAYNCGANGLAKLPHIRHTWGDPFPADGARWDLILASDILLYVKQYPNLIKTLLILLKDSIPEKAFTHCLDSVITNIGTSNVTKHLDSTAGDCELPPGRIQLPKPCFLMSWRRRLPKEDEAAFFDGCKNNGLDVKHLGSRVYCISKLE